MKRTILLFTAAFLAASSAYAGDYVIYQAKNISLAVGEVLHADENVVLKQGQAVTLINESGNFIDLQGPHSGAVNDQNEPNPQGLSEALQALLASSNFKQARSPWVLDVDAGGHQCVEEGQSLVLWKENSDTSVLNIAAGTDYASSTNWPAEVNSINAPSDVPVIDGENYRFKVGDKESVIRLEVVPANLAPAQQAAWLNNMGCAAQATALLNQINNALIDS